MRGAKWFCVLVAILVLPEMTACGGPTTEQLEATALAQRAEARRVARQRQAEIIASVEAELTQLGHATATARVIAQATAQANAYATAEARAAASASAEAEAAAASATANAAVNGSQQTTAGDSPAATVSALAQNTDIAMVRNWAAHEGSAYVAFSPDGKLLASSSFEQRGDGQEMMLWNPADGTMIRSIKPSTTDRRYSAATTVLKWSPDGALLAVGSNDGFIFLYQAADGKQVQMIRDTDRVNDLAWSPDGQILASANSRGLASIWRVADGQIVKRLMGHQSSVQYADWSPDGKTLITAEERGRIRLWRTSDWSQLLGADEKWKRFGLFIASPIGPLAISAPSGSSDDPVLWNVTDGKELTPFQVDNDRRLALIRSSPDGKLLSDGARLWDRASGRLLRTIEPPESGAPTSVSWSADNQMLAVGYGDGTIWLWQIARQS
jgi:WD40 repeat protein